MIENFKTQNGDWYMKRLFLIAFLCLQTFTMSAQMKKYPPKESLESIEKMILLVQYDVDWHHKLTRSDEMMHDKMHTEIGHHTCHSYIEREWDNEVILNQYFEESGKRGTRAFGELYSILGEIFINYPKGKNTVIFGLDALGTYKYEETTPNFKWNITQEKLDTLDYHCKMATCSYAGREYKAWFTEDIPVSFGPWKLCGLPGLIIKAETVDGDYHFVLKSIEKVESDSNIQLWKRDFVKASRKKVFKQEKLLLARPDAILDQMGINYTVTSKHGPAKWKFITFDNPLEKE